MRKSTKNKLTKSIHVILIILTVIVALITSLYAAIRDVTVQSLIVRSVAGRVSQLLNTEVKVKTFYITPNLEVHINGVQIYDLDKYPLLKIDEFKTGLSLELPVNGLRLKEVYLKNAYGNIVTYEGNEKSNLAELLAQIPEKEKTEKKSSGLNLAVDNIVIDNAHFIMWNQNMDNPELKSMDYKHMDIDSVSLVMNDFAFRNDSISGYIKKLKANERCGINLKSFSTNVLVCPNDIILDDLLIDLNHSHLDLDLEFKINGYDDFKSFVDSVVFAVNIRNTHLKLSDVKYWASIMEKMPNDIYLNTDFNGPINDFRAENLDLKFGECSNIQGSVFIKGIARKKFDESYWVVDFPCLSTSYNDLINFHIPSKSETIPLPQKLEPIGKFAMVIDYKGTPRNLDLKVDAETEIGGIIAELLLRREMNNEPEYHATVTANNLDLTKVTGGKDNLRSSLTCKIDGFGFDKNSADLVGEIDVKSLEVMKNVFEDFKINAGLKNKMLSVATAISNPNVKLDLKASADLNGKTPVFKAVGNVRDANLNGLNLIKKDTVMIAGTDLDVTFSGLNINDLTLDAKLNSFTFFNGMKFLNINHLEAGICENHGVKSANVNCDFFEFQADGIFNFGTLVKALKNSVLQNIHLSSLKPDEGLYKVDKQEFSFSIKFNNTDKLMAMFVPKLHVAPGTNFSGTFTTGHSDFGQTIESPEIRFGGMIARNLDIRNNMNSNEIVTKLSLQEFILADSTEKHPYKNSLENIAIVTNVSNDTASMSINMDNLKYEHKTIVDINADFMPHGDSGWKLLLSSDTLVLADTILYLKSDSHIDFTDHNIHFHNFGFHTASQSLDIDGSMPNMIKDTLNISFKNMDVSDFNFLFYGKDLKFNGVLNGDFELSGIKEQTSFSSGLELRDFFINSNDVGDIHVNSSWDDAEKSVSIKADIYNKDNENKKYRSFDLSGNYSPQKVSNSIDLKMNVNGFKLNSIEPFVKSMIGRMDGEMNGLISIGGTLSKPVLEGNIVMKDAGCKVNFLNTYYKINDTIRLSENSIDFDKLQLMDSLGNKAYLHGSIKHNYLKDFNMDISMKCDDFMAMDIPAEKANGFYGSAIADGDVHFMGPLNDIKLLIDVRTKKGTEINIPLSGSSSIDNNFIVFVNKNVAVDTDTIETFAPMIRKNKNFSLILNADVNPDAKLNIFLPSNMGKINANGTGNVNIGIIDGEFGLKGDYVINSGQFAFRLKVVSRNFNIRKGGTIRFNGNAKDADIDIVAAYRTKASLRTIVDSTMIANNGVSNVNVDCILHLKNKMLNPTINFRLEFPNVNDNVKNLIFSSIDTTNQTVMAQHVLSLMVVGMFANTGTANIENVSTTATYSVITSQLNNWLSQISKDFDIGINYKPNDNYTNEEIEVAMSTQLFDDRLTIEGNFGVIRGNNVTNNANNIVGDVDISFKLTNRLSLKAYNHTNVNNTANSYSFENLSNFTQGVGISLSQSFNKFKEIFMKQNKDKDKAGKPDKKEKKNKKDKNQNNETNKEGTIKEDDKPE